MFGPFLTPKKGKIGPEIRFWSILQKVSLDSHETSF